MREGYLEGYIQAKLAKGGKRDQKAALYAGQLRDLYGDENMSAQSPSELREFVRINEDRIGVEVHGFVNALSRNQVRFLYPLALNPNTLVDTDVVYRTVSPGLTISPSGLSVLYG